MCVIERRIKMLYSFQVMRESKSGNAFAYSHWSKRSSDSRAWFLLVAAAAGLAGIPCAKSRRKVIITTFRRKKLDDDNLSAGLKGARDALTKTKLILDDTSKCSVFEYRQRSRELSPNGKSMTLFELEDAPDEQVNDGF